MNHLKFHVVFRASTLSISVWDWDGIGDDLVGTTILILRIDGLVNHGKKSKMVKIIGSHWKFVLYIINVLHSVKVN